MASTVPLEQSENDAAIAALPALPITRTIIRDRCIDVEIKGTVARDLDSVALSLGDIVDFNEGMAPVVPEFALFTMEEPVRKGLLVTVRPAGPQGEDVLILTKRFLKSSCYTLLQERPRSEFTVHRHITVEGNDMLKLHFAHGAQLLKLGFQEGSSVLVKEKPCGLDKWEVVNIHTEDLDKCPKLQDRAEGSTR